MFSRQNTWTCSPKRRPEAPPRLELCCNHGITSSGDRACYEKTKDFVTWPTEASGGLLLSELLSERLTMSSMPIVFQLCMMGRKEMNVGMSQQPLSIAATLTGVILCL